MASPPQTSRAWLSGPGACGGGLTRVFRIDIERCERCGGTVRVIASIETSAVIGWILMALEQRRPPPAILAAHPPRGPPRQGRLNQP